MRVASVLVTSEGLFGSYSVVQYGESILDSLILLNLLSVIGNQEGSELCYDSKIFVDGLDQTGPLQNSLMTWLTVDRLGRADLDILDANLETIESISLTLPRDLSSADQIKLVFALLAHLPSGVYYRITGGGMVNSIGLCSRVYICNLSGATVDFMQEFIGDASVIANNTNVENITMANIAVANTTVTLPSVEFLPSNGTHVYVIKLRDKHDSILAASKCVSCSPSELDDYITNISNPDVYKVEVITAKVESTKTLVRGWITPPPTVEI